MKYLFMILFLGVSHVSFAGPQSHHIKAEGGGYGEREARSYAKKHATEAANKLCGKSPINYRGRRFSVVSGSTKLTSNCIYSIPYGDCIAVAGIELDVECRDVDSGFWF